MTGTTITEMNRETFFNILVSGDRPAARALVSRLMDEGISAVELIEDLFWPMHEHLAKLRKRDQITTLAEHTASRLLRILVDQNAARLPMNATRGRTIYAFCGTSEVEEMGAQMAVDMLEAHGFTVRFGGGGIANDEVLARVQTDKPDVLLMFSSAPSDLPNIRALIDTLQEIGACPDIQIAVGGGVFNRASGLAEEIGADLWAYSPMEIVEALVEEPARRAEANQRTVGKMRKVKKAA